MEIKEITGDNFQTEVTKAAQPVLLEFYADGCSFCKAQLSVLEEAAEEACDVKFVRVNGDKERTLAGQFGVTVLPTMLIMNGEQIFRRITGYQSLETILSIWKCKMRKGRRKMRSVRSFVMYKNSQEKIYESSKAVKPDPSVL